MLNIILLAAGALCLVMYLMRRRARATSEDA